MACRTSIERRVWAVAVALGLCVVAPAVEAQQVVKLAAGVPLTGPLAKQGQEVADAVKLAAEEWNKRSEEHTSELQSLAYLVCRLLLEKKKCIHACRWTLG